MCGSMFVLRIVNRDLLQNTVKSLILPFQNEEPSTVYTTVNVSEGPESQLPVYQ